jgi:hypothetical protein
VKSLEDQEWVENIKDLAGKINCYLSQKSVEKLLASYLLEDDAKEKIELKNDLESILAIHAPKLFFSEKPMLQSPSIEDSIGEIKLGNIVQGDREIREFRISLLDVNKHLAIFSSTGSGKTTLIINILLQLLDRNIPFLAIDFKKDLRHLAREYPIKVLRWNWLKINPLQPPKGVEEKQWMTILADIMAHVFGWFWASENYLMQFMNQLYENHKGKRYPTIREVYELIVSTEETSRRISEYRDVVMNRLASMLIVLKDVIDCEHGFPIEELLNYPVVIELDGLRRDEANFLVEYLLAYIFAYRIANNQRGSIKHVLVFDEATRVFFRKREWKETTVELGMPFIDTVPQIIRDYREGMIFAAQEPSIISHSVLANTNLKLVGFLGEGEDIEAIARSLDLSDEERSAISKLEVGYWLVKKAGMKPFLLRSSDFPLEKNVSDEELEERMKPVIRKLSAEKREEPKDKEAVNLPLSEDAWKLLVHVNDHPFQGMVARAKGLQFSGRRIELAKQELIEKKLVSEVGIVLTAKRPTLFLIPTNGALMLLESKGLNTDLWKHIGNVGFEHILYQVLIRYEYQKLGYQARIESEIQSGRRVDVLAVKENEKIGIEIELNPYNEQRNKLIGIDDLDELYILSNSEENLELIKARIGIIPSKVKFSTVRNFLAHLHNIERNYSGIYSSGQNKPEFNGSRNLIGGESKP